MMYSGGVLLCVASVFSVGPAPDYCSLKEKCDTYSPPEHIYCLYKNSDPGPNCANYSSNSSLTHKEKGTIVSVHNTYRSTVAMGNATSQPTAANMRALIWDDTLAKMAQRLANQCQMKHVCSHLPDLEVGQNLAWRWDARPNAVANLELQVKSWYNEIKNMDPAGVKQWSNTKASMIGHYTQLVWAETTLVGCGRAVYGSTETLLVCNYGIGGNLYNAPVYREGSPCSACPNGTACSKKHPGLCEKR